MIIGFAQRSQTVYEAGDSLVPVLFFDIPVHVRSMIMSEINYNVSFEAPVSNMGRTANVEHSQITNLLDHDARFGNINPTTGDLEIARLLFSGRLAIQPPLMVTIVNDFIAEPEECFTIDIASPDVIGDRDIFECFDDDDNSDSFFCLHEICIEDDDGLFKDILFEYIVKMFFFTSSTICCCIC